jgi:hypothetical protein
LCWFWFFVSDFGSSGKAARKTPSSSTAKKSSKKKKKKAESEDEEEDEDDNEESSPKSSKGKKKGVGIAHKDLIDNATQFVSFSGFNWDVADVEFNRGILQRFKLADLEDASDARVKVVE